jgi:ribosomal protein L37AE/L43A
VADILDYSEYFVRRARELIATYHDQASPDDEENARAEAWNRQNYYAPRGLCPFCQSQAPIVHEASRYSTYTTVWECDRCGWWEHEEEYREGAAIGHPAFTGVNHQAFLRSFKPSAKDVPMKALLRTIDTQPNIVHEVHPGRFEEVVQHVFGSYFSCEVIHCGRSHDGGIDLVMIDSDAPTLIQVKRRGARNAVECVSSIRELLGSMLVARSRKGVFVSTADHFSPDAEKTVAKILAEGTVTRFELITRSGFLERLKVARAKERPVWHDLIRE